MRAGELRQRVTLQKPTRSQNSFKEWVDSWTDVATVWGAVEPASGKQYFEAMQASSEVQGVVKIRYRSDIKSDWRLKLGSRVLQIISLVNVKELDKELHIYYKEALD